VASDEFGEDVLVIRSQMLYKNKGHTGIDAGGHAGEKRLEGRQSSGGRADADNGEAFSPGTVESRVRRRLLAGR